MYIWCLVIVIYVFVYIAYKLQCTQCFIYGNPEIEIIEEYLYGEETGAFVHFVDNQCVGLALCSLRHDYVEGCKSSPVGYLEGIVVDAQFRKHGIARVLCAECEQWAKDKGCKEFASDCELDNEESLLFHLKMGFEEANRIICFTKKL